MEQLQVSRADLDNSSLAVEYLQKQNGELQEKLDLQEHELLNVKYNNYNSKDNKLRDVEDDHES